MCSRKFDQWPAARSRGVMRRGDRKIDLPTVVERTVVVEVVEHIAFDVAVGVDSRTLIGETHAGTPTPFHIAIERASGGQRSMHSAQRMQRSSSSSSTVPPG